MQPVRGAMAVARDGRESGSRCGIRPVGDDPGNEDDPDGPGGSDHPDEYYADVLPRQAAARGQLIRAPAMRCGP